MKKYIFLIVITIILVLIAFLVLKTNLKCTDRAKWGISCQFFLKYNDGGKLCHSSDECLGDCEIEPQNFFSKGKMKEKIKEGHCSEDNDGSGCSATIEDQMGVCSD